MLLTADDLSALSTALGQCKPLTLPPFVIGDRKICISVCPASPAWPVEMLVRVEIWWPGWYLSKYCESAEEAEEVINEQT